MKLRGKALNLRALKNHLGLSRAVAQAIDEFAANVDFGKCSVCVFDGPRDNFSIEVTESKVASWKGESEHGISVCYGLSDVDRRYGPTIVIPWRLVMKGAPDCGHLVYLIQLKSAIHLFGVLSTGIPRLALTEKGMVEVEKSNKDIWENKVGDKHLLYVGKTSRGIVTRFCEHIIESVKGTRTQFYTVMAGGDQYQPMLPICFALDSANDSETAYDLEEKHIKDLFESGDYAILNTVHSRQAYADLIARHPSVAKTADPERAEELLARLSKNTESLWLDPAYAESVICNNDRNFTGAQVRQIRMLASMGMQPNAIARSIGVQTYRVSGVVENKTYGRIL